MKIMQSVWIGRAASNHVLATVLFCCLALLCACAPEGSGIGASGQDDHTQRADPRVGELVAVVARLTARVNDLELENAQLRAEMHASAPASPTGEAAITQAEATPQGMTQTQQPAADVVVFVTRSGSKYHTASCQYARSGSAATLAQAAARLQPCKVCNPPVLPKSADSTPAPSAGSSAVAPSVSSPPKPAAVLGGQCAATTQKGTRCKRSAKPGSSYCWQHGG